MTKHKRPVLIEADDLPQIEVTPETAPPVAEPAPAMVRATQFGARGMGWLGRLFWGAALGLLTVMLTTAAWDFANDLLSRNIWLGRVTLGFIGILAAVVVSVICRELAALSRLARVDHIRTQAQSAVTGNKVADAEKTLHALQKLYRGRADLEWAGSEIAARQHDQVDADALLALAERSYLTELDKRAAEEIRTATRSVAAATALLPLALADVIVALTANTRMIRRIAEIYGGRAGTLGAWRLFRAVASHLVATGAVAIGDDLVTSVLGGGALARISRRFGEGLVNGALTARVGVAAMDVCRPLPFQALKRPSVTQLVKTALTGMFGTKSSGPVV